MWVETYHIVVGVTLSKLTALWIWAITLRSCCLRTGQKDCTRFCKNVILDVEQSKKVLALRNLAGFLVAKNRYSPVVPDFWSLLLYTVHCHTCTSIAVRIQYILQLTALLNCTLVQGPKVQYG